MPDAGAALLQVGRLAVAGVAPAPPALLRSSSTPLGLCCHMCVCVYCCVCVLGMCARVRRTLTEAKRTAEAVRQANRRTSEAIRAWKRERHDKDKQQLQQLQQLQHQLPEKPATALPPQPLSPADGGADACVCGGGGGGEACGSCCNSEGFVAEDACSDMQIVGQAGRSIVKLGHSAHSSFALFRCQAWSLCTQFPCFTSTKVRILTQKSSAA
jgi:hypothetical protein